jgi:hypothetical protein
MLSPLEKRSPAPLAAGKSRAHRSIKRENNSTAAAEIEAARLHALGERPLFELFRELLAGADVASRLEAYARIDVDIYAAVASLAIDGGRA